jgi:arylsulfatase A-like enzyme
MRTTEHKPDIVFIVLDTHRVDRMGCYGYARDTTPNLDAFAQAATVYEEAIAPAQWTIPSHASMFSGEPPSVHMVVQSGDVLDFRFKTLAELLRENGYRTIGFCNNPLVGVINNGFRRGFEDFYNYGGAIPSGLDRPSRPLLAPLSAARRRFVKALHKISYSIQDVFASSRQMFQAALNPFWVPLWTQFANFKGNTRASIEDVTHFVRQYMGEDDAPCFLFLNLMETHLPFSAPEEFVDAFAPYLREDRQARHFMRAFNAQAARWITPMDTPFNELEARTLGDMYDAEVAYQDHLLAPLIDLLDQRKHRNSTLTMFVADHGEMLGEHQLIGHAFGVYQELVHVPLLIRSPGQTTGQRVAGPVSATRLFHTVLDVAGIESYAADCSNPADGYHPMEYGPAVDVRSQSLLREANGGRQSQRQSQPEPPQSVLSEAYVPEFALAVAEAQKPHLIEKRDCRATWRAVYGGRHKLIHVENARDELFALDADPLEAHSLAAEAGTARVRDKMLEQLEAFLEKAKARRSGRRERETADVDEAVRQRLRHLGYF